MNFKEYVGEATAADFKAQGYGGTSNRTKFQIGDYVVITDSQTRRGEKYINKHGKIVGYKPFSMTVKYAVEFPDGEADAYFGQMIAGPFKDEAAAIKYSKQIIKLKLGSPLPRIVASDLRGYVDKPLDTNPKFEAFLKQLLTAEPFNMQWLDTPVQFSDGKYTVSVLAIKPTNFKKYGVNDIRVVNTKLTSNSLQNYLRNNVCLLRQNNAVNGKLVTQNYIRGLPSFNASSPYFMSMMWLDVSSIRYNKKDYNASDINFFDKKELSSALKEVIDKIDIHGVALPVSLVKKPNELITAFKAPYEVLSGNYDPRMLFDLYYDVIEHNGGKTITGRIRADETTLKYFENYTQHYEPGSYGNSELVIQTDQPDRLVIPPGMRRIILAPKTGNTKLNIKDFSFMPPNAQELTVSEAVIQSLNGLPNIMEKLEIELCQLPSLQGLPKKIGTLLIADTNLKDFTGAEDSEVGNLQGWKNDFTSLKGVPKAKHYGLGEKFSEKQIKKVIADREMVKRLDKDEQEAWGDIVTSL